MTTFNPERYGLTLDMSPDNLVKARQAFVELVNSLGKVSEATQNVEKSVRDSLKNVDVSKEVSAGLETIRQGVFDLLQENENVSVWLYEQLAELLSDVKDYRDYEVTKLARGSKPDLPVDFDDRKKEAETLRDFIVNFFGAVQPMVSVGAIELPKQKEFPTKKSKSGDVMPDLPRIPSGPRSGNVGRGAKTRRLRFAWNGEELPSDTLLIDVAMNIVSDANFRVTGKDVLQTIRERDAHENNPFDGKIHSIEFPTGRLALWLPQDEVDSEEEETDETE